jgi:hypothetical protein
VPAAARRPWREAGGASWRREADGVKLAV